MTAVRFLFAMRYIPQYYVLLWNDNKYFYLPIYPRSETTERKK